MRWLRRLGLLVWLTGQAASPPALAADPGMGLGCVGMPLADCLASLRATMRVDEHVLAASMSRRHQTDVNGRPLGGGLLTVNAQLPAQTDVFVILLHLRPDDTVIGADANLLYGLADARTEPEYDRSGLYEIVRRLVGRRCAGLAKRDLYRVFENSVKPRLTHERQDLSAGLNGLHRILSHAPAVPLCGGVSLSYANRLQWRGAQDPQAAAKLDQFAYIELR